MAAYLPSLGFQRQGRPGKYESLCTFSLHTITTTTITTTTTTTSYKYYIILLLLQLLLLLLNKETQMKLPYES